MEGIQLKVDSSECICKQYVKSNETAYIVLCVRYSVPFSIVSLFLSRAQLKCDGTR